MFLCKASRRSGGQAALVPTKQPMLPSAAPTSSPMSFRKLHSWILPSNAQLKSNCSDQA